MLTQGSGLGTKKAGRVLPAFLRHLGDASGNTAFVKEIKLCSRV